MFVVAESFCAGHLKTSHLGSFLPLSSSHHLLSSRTPSMTSSIPSAPALSPGIIHRRTIAASALDDNNNQMMSLTRCDEDFSTNIGEDGPSSLGKCEGMVKYVAGKWKIIIFGQLLAFWLSVKGMVMSKMYLDCNLSAPMFSVLSFMLPLCIISLGIMTRNQCRSPSTDDTAGSNDIINAPSEKYFSFFGLKCTNRPRTYAIIAIVDVYAAFCAITAFKYTTITSVALFDALAIHSAMFVSRFFFNRRYVKGHLLGVVICTIGIMLNVAVDYKEDKELKGFFVGQDNADQQIIAEKYPHKIAGDILAISGGLLYGIANTLQEVAVKETTVAEYLGCSCFFASIITFSQAMITEREEIMAFFGQSSTDTCAAGEGENLLFLYAIAGILKYVGVGIFLQISDATFFNLSLMTGDAWVVAFSVFAEGIKPPPTFYIALVLTMSGVLIYETAPSSVVNTDREIKEDTQAIDCNLTEGVELHLRDEEDHLIT